MKLDEIKKPRNLVEIGGFILLLMLPPTVISATGDIVIPRKEGSMSEESLPASTFPHWLHRARYRCDACHLDLFPMEAGTAEISMADINEGRACGTCHNGETAFSAGFANCNRCHVPEETE